MRGGRRRRKRLSGAAGDDEDEAGCDGQGAWMVVVVVNGRGGCYLFVLHRQSLHPLMVCSPKNSGCLRVQPTAFHCLRTPYRVRSPLQVPRPSRQAVPQRMRRFRCSPGGCATPPPHRPPRPFLHLHFTPISASIAASTRSAGARPSGEPPPNCANGAEPPPDAAHLERNPRIL